MAEKGFGRNRECGDGRVGEKMGRDGLRVDRRRMS